MTFTRHDPHYSWLWRCPKSWGYPKSSSWVSHGFPLGGHLPWPGRQPFDLGVSAEEAADLGSPVEVGVRWWRAG